VPVTLPHPHQLHAFNALWSLRRSWPMLRAAASAVALQPADGLHGQTFGSRHGIGGHSGGALDALVEDLDEHERYGQLLDQVREHVIQACWLVRSGQPDVGRDAQALAYLAAAIPAATPATARDIAAYVRDADHIARSAVGRDLDRQPLVGADCPGCMARMLELHTAAPDRVQWTVVCAARCRCRGDRCPCAGRGVAPAADVPHIWPWIAVLAPALEEATAA
jgi:hypothetical protein